MLMRKARRVVSVRKYIKKDKTVVEAHRRTLPDGIKKNNHSYKG